VDEGEEVPPEDLRRGVRKQGSARSAPFLSLQLLPRRSKQDLVDVDLLRLADREGDGAKESAGIAVKCARL
jgi:hypothetical protein